MKRKNALPIDPVVDPQNSAGSREELSDPIRREIIARVGQALEEIREQLAAMAAQQRHMAGILEGLTRQAERDGEKNGKTVGAVAGEAELPLGPPVRAGGARPDPRKPIKAEAEEELSIDLPFFKWGAPEEKTVSPEKIPSESPPEREPVSSSEPACASDHRRVIHQDPPPAPVPEKKPPTPAAPANEEGPEETGLSGACPAPPEETFLFPPDCDSRRRSLFAAAPGKFGWAAAGLILAAALLWFAKDAMLSNGTPVGTASPQVFWQNAQRQASEPLAGNRPLPPHAPLSPPAGPSDGSAPATAKEEPPAGNPAAETAAEAPTRTTMAAAPMPQTSARTGTGEEVPETTGITPVERQPEIDAAGTDDAQAFLETPDAKEDSHAHPYAILLASLKSPKRAKRAVEIFRRAGLHPYWTEVDLEEDGIWYRVFTGKFRTADEAKRRLEELGRADAMVKPTRWAAGIGIYEGTEAARIQRRLERETPWMPYGIDLDADRRKIYVGAFYTETGARRQCEMLMKRGFDCRVQKR